LIDDREKGKYLSFSKKDGRISENKGRNMGEILGVIRAIFMKE